MSAFYGTSQLDDTAEDDANRMEREFLDGNISKVDQIMFTTSQKVAKHALPLSESQLSGFLQLKRSEAS